MKLIVPFVEDGLAEEVRDLGNSLDAEFVLTPRADTTSYCALMSRLWSEGEGFIVVEQDVLPTVEILHEMWTCPEEWCHGYWIDPPSDIPHWQWLGCAHFSASLLKRAPDIMGKLAEQRQTHWNQQDISLCLALQATRDGRGPHLHNPPVTHLHREMEERRKKSAASG